MHTSMHKLFQLLEQSKKVVFSFGWHGDVGRNFSVKQCVYVCVCGGVKCVLVQGRRGHSASIMNVISDEMLKLGGQECVLWMKVIGDWIWREKAATHLTPQERKSYH